MHKKYYDPNTRFFVVYAVHEREQLDSVDILCKLD